MISDGALSALLDRTLNLDRSSEVKKKLKSDTVHASIFKVIAERDLGGNLIEVQETVSSITCSSVKGVAANSASINITSSSADGAIVVRSDDAPCCSTTAIGKDCSVHIPCGVKSCSVASCSSSSLSSSSSSSSSSTDDSMDSASTTSTTNLTSGSFSPCATCLSMHAKKQGLCDCPCCKKKELQNMSHSTTSIATVTESKSVVTDHGSKSVITASKSVVA